MANETAIRTALAEACQERGKQAEIASAFEVHPSTVKRWLDGGDIPSPILKLLALYLFGEIPFEMVHPKQNLSSILRFTPEEWKMIELLARRVGVEPGEWIRDQVQDYLGFLEAKASLAKEAGRYGAGLTVVPSARVAEEASEAPKIAKGFFVDLRGGIAAGSPISAHVVEEPIPVGKDYPDDHYALRVFGESMAPRIPDGATIIVKAWPRDRTPKRGMIVVYSDAMGSALKEFGYRKAKAGEEADAMGNVPVLRSLNPAFPEVQTMEGGKIDASFVELA